MDGCALQAQGKPMQKPNYSFEKRQREQAKREQPAQQRKDQGSLRSGFGGLAAAVPWPM